MQNKDQALIVLLAVISLVVACRKNVHSGATPAKFTGCRISTIGETGANTTAQTIYSFKYNDNGALSQISMNAQPGLTDVFVKTFSYYNDHIIIYTTDNNELSSKDSLLLDTQKRMIYIDHHDYNGGPPPNVDWTQYQRDSSGNVVSYIMHYYSTISSATYYWQDGDILWNTYGTDYVSFLYDTTPYNTGNIKALLVDFEEYGQGIFTTGHLRTMAIIDNTDTTLYHYSFDSGGRLNHITRTEPGNYVFNTDVAYTCE